MSDFLINLALSVVFSLLKAPSVSKKYLRALIKLRDKLIEANLGVEE